MFSLGVRVGVKDRYLDSLHISFPSFQIPFQPHQYIQELASLSYSTYRAPDIQERVNRSRQTLFTGKLLQLAVYNFLSTLPDRQTDRLSPGQASPAQSSLVSQPITSLQVDVAAVGLAAGKCTGSHEKMSVWQGIRDGLPWFSRPSYNSRKLGKYLIIYSDNESCMNTKQILRLRKTEKPLLQSLSSYSFFSLDGFCKRVFKIQYTYKVWAIIVFRHTMLEQILQTRKVQPMIVK